MPLKFKSETVIEFHDMESLEAFVRALPLPTHQQVELLNDGSTIDASDKVEVTGSGKVVHKFSIEGQE